MSRILKNGEGGKYLEKENMFFCEEVSDYIVNPIKKVLSVRFSNGSGT